MINQPYGLTFEILQDGKLILNDLDEKQELDLDPIDQIDSIETIKMIANGICFEFISSSLIIYPQIDMVLSYSWT